MPMLEKHSSAALRRFINITANSYKKSAPEHVIYASAGSPAYAIHEYMSMVMDNINNIEGDTRYYKSTSGHRGADEDITTFLHKHGMLHKSEPIIIGKNATFAHGVTQLFSRFSDALLKKNDVLLLPTPTYGFFARHPNLDKKNVYTFPLSKENGYRITPDQLQEILESDYAKPKKNGKTWLFLINPHNPTGAIHTEKHIHELANILLKNENSHVHVLQDMVYAGTEHDNFFKPSQTAGSFANIEILYPRTLTFHGLSKAYGGANLRCGFAFGSQRIVHELIEALNYEHEFASSSVYNNYSVVAYAETKGIRFKFPPLSPPERSEREDNDPTITSYNAAQVHRSRNARAHQFRSQLIQALINGDIPFLTQYRDDPYLINRDGSPWFEDLYNPHDKPLIVPTKQHGYEEAEDMALPYPLREQQLIFDTAIQEKGVPGLRIDFKPQAGFFQLINVDGLIGKFYGKKPLKNAIDVAETFLKHGVEVLPGEIFLHPKEECVVRLSYSCHISQLVYAVGAMQRATCFITDSPEKLHPTAKIPPAFAKYLRKDNAEISR